MPAMTIGTTASTVAPARILPRMYYLCGFMAPLFVGAGPRVRVEVDDSGPTKHHKGGKVHYLEWPNDDPVISARVLNRTLLQRQHLLHRATITPLAMTEHLVGLQAQEVLPPYLSLFSRLRDFDPSSLSALLEDRTAVRVL